MTATAVFILRRFTCTTLTTYQAPTVVYSTFLKYNYYIQLLSKKIIIFIATCVIIALVIYFFPTQVLSAIGQIIEIISGGGIVVYIITLVAIIGFIMTSSFLTGNLTIENNEIDTPSKTDSVPSTIKIDVPIMSGFKFGVGFVLGLFIMGIVLLVVASTIFLHLIQTFGQLFL